MKSEGIREAYLIGIIHASMSKVHFHMLQGDNNEALSLMNEAMRTLGSEVNKLFYAKEDHRGELANVNV